MRQPLVTLYYLFHLHFPENLSIIIIAETQIQFSLIRTQICLESRFWHQKGNYCYVRWDGGFILHGKSIAPDITEFCQILLYFSVLPLSAVFHPF